MFSFRRRVRAEFELSARARSVFKEVHAPSKSVTGAAALSTDTLIYDVMHATVEFTRMRNHVLLVIFKSL